MVKVGAGGMGCARSFTPPPMLTLRFGPIAMTAVQGVLKRGLSAGRLITSNGARQSKLLGLDFHGIYQKFRIANPRPP